MTTIDDALKIKIASDMAYANVLDWIAKESVDLCRHISFHWMHDKYGNAESMNGALTALEKLRLHILMKTNPHNREDIRKYNEKENERTNEQKCN